LNNTFRLYSDLSWLWPMWGEAEVEYAHYGAYVEEMIRQYARRPVSSLLYIGCGGGKNVFKRASAGVWTFDSSGPWAVSRVTSICRTRTTMLRSGSDCR
jgi:hypothetical protein